ncbi:Opsin-like protein carO [Exophiala dermatitidis]|uniref:Bacteriorhodopsin n=2 Tax=Exophiala dermatitidis TaxID=5970 RepID=H6C3U7_EXODN|nr:bacteriorhodopsin [Exophiala dermatitidis NIH/UT8656]KAJ4514004.1 hypothetical protein HRR75_004585 [Exophiala dermatitidis]EHY58312.1 bacteriorhodopsin [Exophiala dermatitidis NIH/UT8656]KAJ4517255.1 hypothetical protein HRR74_005005 [Exophiala dermatitidis]KAJ4534636.1 hypothetical protein HRR76_006554 [Exophiala dermatitidis]KAJ4541619.1 hypothetical protein HRR78_007503 [Exophiala dermatitidis]
MAELDRRNNAVNINPFTQNNKSVVVHQTDRGSDWYYAVCAVMGVTALAILGLSRLKPRTDRIFFYLSSGLCFVACIAYFAMGSNLGWTPIDVEYLRSDSEVAGRNRQIFYVRYIDWVITTPLLLTDLLLTAGMPWPTILWVIGLDEIMIVTGLVGALVKSRYKWGFYAFGCAAMFYVFYELAFPARRHAAALGNDVHRAFVLCGVLTLVVWLCYPIAWGVSEGGNVIAPDSEGIFYGILDLLAKPVFSLALIYSHWSIEPARLGVQIREFGPTDDLSSAEREKRFGNGQSNGNNGVTGGVAGDHHAVAPGSPAV